MMAGDSIWGTVGYWTHLASAVICAILAVWVSRNGQARSHRSGVSLALTLTAAWALIAAASSPLSFWALLAESARNLGWLFLLYHLFAADGRHASIRPIRPVLFVLSFLEGLQPALLLIQLQLLATTGAVHIGFQVAVILHLLVTVGALLLVHNLYVGVASTDRPEMRWPAAALAALWVVDLNYYTVAYLSNGVAIELAALRGIVVAAAAVPLAIGVSRVGQDRRFKPSRAVTFQTLSLVAIGLYLLLMVVIARSLTVIGGDFARLTQVGFLFTASVVALIWLPSQKLRSWLKVTTIKHFFQHRYDYRAEWLRLTRTIGRTGADAPSLHERVVQAVAEICDSPSGLLLLRGENTGLELAARWQWPDIDVPAPAFDSGETRFFETGNFICDLDDIRGGADRQGEAEAIPSWLRENGKAWAIVPLLHYERLMGLVVLARPHIVRKLDWEDFDLLRVVGQQLASYIAEQAGQNALNEASRFDEFNRRIAFVMHDVKNLASQISLLASNAEKHVEKPEFRADMLVTLRNSAEKLNGLLARLGRYRAQGAEKLEALSLDDCAQTLANRYASTANVVLVESEPCMVEAQREGLEQALVHLIQNAIDASDEQAPIFLRVHTDGLYGVIEIVDSGSGMTPEFVRTQLFKPFVSSKPGGFGIGAFEARELITAMRGRLDVESREGLGTRFFVRLPRAGIKELSDKLISGKSEVA